MGPEETEAIFRRIGERIAEEAPAPHDGQNFEDRLDQAASFLEELGFLFRWEKTDEGYLLTNINCPYRHVTRDHPRSVSWTLSCSAGFWKWSLSAWIASGPELLPVPASSCRRTSRWVLDPSCSKLLQHASIVWRSLDQQEGPGLRQGQALLVRHTRQDFRLGFALGPYKVDLRNLVRAIPLTVLRRP